MTDAHQPPPLRPEAGVDSDPSAAPTDAVARHLDLDQLCAYLDGELGAADRRAAATHLAACRDCRRELAELRATIGLLRDLPQYAPRRSFRLGPEHARPHPAGPRWLPRLLPALPALRAATAAVAALFLLAVAGGLAADQTADEPAARSVAPAVQVAPDQSDSRAAEPAVPGDSLPAVGLEQAPAPAAGGEAPQPTTLPGAAPAGDAAADVELADPSATVPLPGAPAPAAATQAAGGPAPAPASATTTTVSPPTGPTTAEPDLGRAVSGWRRAQIGLGLLLLPLLAALLAAEWLRLRRR